MSLPLPLATPNSCKSSIARTYTYTHLCRWKRGLWVDCIPTSDAAIRLSLACTHLETSFCCFWAWDRYRAKRRVLRMLKAITAPILFSQLNFTFTLYSHHNYTANFLQAYSCFFDTENDNFSVLLYWQVSYLAAGDNGVYSHPCSVQLMLFYKICPQHCICCEYRQLCEHTKLAGQCGLVIIIWGRPKNNATSL